MSSRGAVVLVLALTALAVPLGEGVAAQATPPANTAEPAISGRAEQGVRLSASTGTWTGTKPISYAYQWVRCGVDGGQPDGGNCAIVSGATGNRYRLVSADVGFRMRVRVTATNVDGSRTAASNPTAVVGGPPVNTSTPSVRGTMTVGSVVTADPGIVDRRPADLVLVPLASMQHAGRKLRLDRRGDGSDVSAGVRRRQPQDPLQRHRAELARVDDGHLGRVGDRHGAAPGRGHQAAERRDVDSGDERAVEPATHRLGGAVLAEPGDEPKPADHRPRSREGHARVRDPRCARLRPLDPESDLGWRSTSDDGRRVGHLPARAERQLPEAPKRVQRAVLREGVSIGRPCARRYCRLPTGAGSPGGGSIERCDPAAKRPASGLRQDVRASADILVLQETLERGPTRVRVALEVLVRLDVEVLPADRAQPGTVRPHKIWSGSSSATASRAHVLS